MNPNEAHFDQSLKSQSNYYTISDFNSSFNPPLKTKPNSSFDNNANSGSNPYKNFSLFHWNARSLNKNFESFELLLSSLQHFPFSAIGITETWLHHNSPDLFNIDNYKLFRSDRKNGRGGGVALYMYKQLHVKIRTDIHIEGCEDLFVEIKNVKHKNQIVGVIYRPPGNIVDGFLDKLDECLDIITHENKEVYLMGDYNIDMSKTDTLATKLQNIIMSYALHSHVNNPTRISQTSKTLLDNIFSNDIDSNNSINGILYFDASDHLPIFTIRDSASIENTRKPIPKLYRKETDKNIRLLYSDLTQELWEDVYRESNVDKAYDIFLNRLLYYYEKNIPLAKMKSRRKNKHPWITKGIMRSIKTRNKMYKLAVTTQSDTDFKKYRKYRNRLNSLIRLSRKMYYSQKFENNKNNVNGLWDTVKEITGKNNRDHTSVFHDNDNVLTDPNDISDAFNNYFTNLGPNLASKIGNTKNTDFMKFLPPYFSKSLFFTPTDEEEILNIVNTLKASRSVGHDGLSVNILKQIIIPITAPLVHIFNLSISTGKCPNSLKIAKVIPIFKKDDPSLLTNYRPISVLPSFSKILEKIIHKRLYIFLQVNGLLIPNQFGFRKKHSTDYAIVQVLNKITESFANKEHLIGIFMDLSKAFD